MKGKMLALFAVPLFIFFAVKLYVYWQVAHTVDLLRARLEGNLSLEYAYVTSSMDGRIGLQEVTLRPVGANDEMRIGELSVKLPGLLYFLRLEHHLARQEYPQALSLRAQDVVFSTRGELARRWEASMFVDDPEARPRALANCVTRSALPTQLHLLEYEQIRGSLELGYRFDRQARELIVHGSGGHLQGVEFRGEVAVVMRRFDSFNLMRATTNPEIARATLQIDDDGYYDRVFAYCANDDQLSKEAVVALLAEDLVAAFDGLPLQPDPPLLAAYRQFVSAGSRLQVIADPAEPRPLQYLSLYEPGAVPALLNVQTRVN